MGLSLSLSLCLRGGKENPESLQKCQKESINNSMGARGENVDGPAKCQNEKWQEMFGDDDWRVSATRSECSLRGTLSFTYFCVV